MRIGRMVHGAQTAGEADPITGEIPAPREPWLTAVASALADGTVSVAAADSIRSGLGQASENVPVSALAAAARQLCTEAPSLDADRLFKRARQLRDEMDAAGVADREAERRDRRSLRLTQLPDGMGRLVWTMDPETLATVKEIYDRATSPKLGGPRFRTEDEAAAERILADPRTAEQLASDDFAQLLRAGAAADTSLLLGSGAPAVRVLVSASDLAARSGHGYFEGQHDPVSITTVERIACEAGILPIVFDSEGQPLDVGRAQRKFTKRQRIALASRDGGCMAPNCDRPPSWCEAHHIRHWHRDGGETNVEDGILLCKHHHLQYHNDGWEIERRRGRYWLIPPPKIDPKQTARLMESKSGAYRRFRSEQQAG